MSKPSNEAPSSANNRSPQDLKQQLQAAILQNRTSNPPPVENPRFKLLRYFSITSLMAFLLATGLLALLYHRQMINNLVDLTEEKNVTLAQVLANTLWQEHGEFLAIAGSLSDEELKTHPQIAKIRQTTAAQIDRSAIAKFKIFDLEGRIIFSTNPQQIGESYQSSGFLQARSGGEVSQLDHENTFQALNNSEDVRHLISSYIPIRPLSMDGELVGVFELYSDVTPLLNQIHQTQLRLTVGSLMILTVLYGVLFMFMQRADRLIQEQYKKLHASETLYRQQAWTLEKTLDELRKTQAQVIQTEKMSGLGQLVAGVAHEINNPISFIYGNLEYADSYFQELLSLLNLYRHHYPEPSPAIQEKAEAIDVDFMLADLPKLLKSMKVGANRVKQIVSSLRTFSRMDQAGVKGVDLHEGIENTLVILQNRIRSNGDRPAIQITKQYADLPSVQCYPGQINQVWMNLLSNAIDALEDFSNGQASVQSSQVPASEGVVHARIWGESDDDASPLVAQVHEIQPEIRIWTERVEGDRVRVAIADNGSGIPESLHSKLLEPFFTTKTVGKGTGLGLSISYQIVEENHKGKLWFESVVGQGTTFFVELPIR